MHLYQPQFSLDLDLPATDLRKMVLIASTPCCGSHMIGHAMARSGVLGVPFEYLNTANMAEWSRRLGTDGPDATLRSVMERRTTPNGVFGIKAHFSHCDTLGGPERLLATFPNVHVVHLRRADVLRQAISYAIAQQTGNWVPGQVATSDDVRFDADQIRWCLEDIAIQNAQWTRALAETGLTPLNLFYEDAEHDLASAVTTIARFAGVIANGEEIAVEEATTRQSRKARTDAWIEEFANARKKSRAPVQRIRRHLAHAIGK